MSARPLVAFEELRSRFPPDDHDLFVAVGFQKMNAVRAAKFAEGKWMGYTLASYLSGEAVGLAQGLSAAENTLVMEDNTIQPFVTIGHNSDPLVRKSCRTSCDDRRPLLCVVSCGDLAGKGESRRFTVFWVSIRR